jgi:phosphate transport system permease protein
MAAELRTTSLPPLPPHTTPGGGRPGRGRRGRGGESLSTWRYGDRLAYLMCWFCGIALCAIAGAIVLYLAVRGVQYLSLTLLTTHPEPGLDQAKSGGFLDPILGTVLLTLIGILIATPIAVATAVWIVEYGRPSWLARMVESGIEIVAGTPDIVIAIFGLALFQQHLFAPLSLTADGGAVFGRSFLTAGIMMSLIAIPMVFGATREGLQSVPAHVREASYGLGKTKIATIRRVLLPSVRPNISTGMALGMGRICGDTAIVIVLLGATLRLESEGAIPGFDVLKGTGSTLTSYVYNNSPAGEGNAPQKAYAAAFVLLLIVVALNFTVDLIARRGSKTGLETGRLGA